MTRTSNLSPFAYHCTLPDGQVFTIKSATRFYTHNVAVQLGQMPENYNAESHGAEGSWRVTSSHSTEKLAKQAAAKVSARYLRADGSVIQDQYTPYRSFTEVRVVPMDNQRPTDDEWRQAHGFESLATPVHTPEAEVFLPEQAPSIGEPEVEQPDPQVDVVTGQPQVRTERCEHERKAKKGLGTCRKGCAATEGQVVDLSAGCTEAVDQAVATTREAIKASWMESQGVAELLAEGDRKAEAARETLARAEAERPQAVQGARKALREGHRVSWFLVGEDGTWEPYKGQAGCPTRAIRCSCGQSAGPAANGHLRQLAKKHRAGEDLSSQEAKAS